MSGKRHFPTSLATVISSTLIMLLINGYRSEAVSHRIDSRLQMNFLSHHPGTFYKATFLVRGGNSDEDMKEDYDEDLEVERYDDAQDDVASDVEASSEGESFVLKISKNVVVVMGKATIATASALARAVKAGFRGEDVDEDEEEDESSAMSKFIRVLKRMWSAALSPSESDGTDSEPRSSSTAINEKKELKTEKEKADIVDFGTYLAKTYGVKVDRGDSNTRVMGGALGDALRQARSQARLLVAFIPAAKPGRGKKTQPDQLAIQSLLSEEVSAAVEKRAKKKIDSGSFVIWGAKAGSPEAVTAMKRLRAKQLGTKGGKRPMLLVAYPAQVLDASGTPKLVPRLLAQHHCSPPPSSESMAAWLNALRKRHSKQYGSMQHELKERQLFKEREEGYRSSIVSDVERQEQEKIAEQERLAKEAAEKERLEELERRRQELREFLPEQPGKEVKEVMTIALRFATGGSGQRRFTADTSMTVVFNWVDAFYEMERERVILTTMNGQRSFSWEEADVALSETGLGRMTGLRVTQRKKEEEEATTDDQKPRTV